MPNYDVECSACGFLGMETIKLSVLALWDSQKKCPTCSCETGEFRRVISSALAGGMKSTSRSGLLPKRNFTGSEKDDMLHRNAKHHNFDKIAAARESVKKGEFEGF